MEFLVDMVTTVPDGTTDGEVDAIRTREAARARELAAQGHLLRLWRPPLGPGEWRTWGLFQAADATELESVLSSMPLRVWRHDTVTPLTAHPSDPDNGDVMSNQASPCEADMLDAVLTRWKAAVDAHQPEHVAALFTTDAIFQGLHPYTVGPAGVAEYQAIAQRAGFAERVHRGHARGLGGVVLGDARLPDGVGMQALEDRVRREQRGDVFWLVGVDRRLPPGEDRVQHVRLVG